MQYHNPKVEPPPYTLFDWCMALALSIPIVLLVVVVCAFSVVFGTAHILCQWIIGALHGWIVKPNK